MSTEMQVYQESQGFSTAQQAALDERLQEKDIKQRPGAGGKKLSYVSGDYAIATANRIFGFGKWGYRVLSKSREAVGDKEFYTADIELYVIGCPFPFPGEGVGIPQNSTIEQHEKARKEAVTDALKRALRHYGDQFGLSLYNEDNYVEAEDGTEKRVGDVGKKTTSQSPQQQTKRVVDSAPAQQQANGHQEEAQPALSLGKLFLLGKERGLWSETSVGKLYALASKTLGITVDHKSKPSQPQLLQVQAAIEQEAHVSAGAGR